MHAKIISSFPYKCHLARAASLLALLGRPIRCAYKILPRRLRCLGSVVCQLLCNRRGFVFRPVSQPWIQLFAGPHSCSSAARTRQVQTRDPAVNRLNLFSVRQSRADQVDVFCTTSTSNITCSSPTSMGWSKGSNTIPRLSNPRRNACTPACTMQCVK